MSNPLNHIEWAFGALECIHIVSFGIAIGTIALVDFRLLGLGFRGQKPSAILRTTSMWTIGALTTAITSGLLLFSTDPERYWRNEVLKLKLLCLILAVIYNFTVHRMTASSGSNRAVEVIVAIVSLVLWLPVIYGGIFYAFT